VLVQGHTGLNRAVDGDIVALELLPEAEWSGPSEIILEDSGEDPGKVTDNKSRGYGYRMSKNCVKIHKRFGVLEILGCFWKIYLMKIFESFIVSEFTREISEQILTFRGNLLKDIKIS